MALQRRRLRAFVRRHTRLQPIPDLPDVRLQVGDDVMTLCTLAAAELGTADGDLPYWAFPWAGGLAIARYLNHHEDEVAGKRVLDIAAGSGLCAIVAARLGAASSRAIDVDPLAGAAVAVNAQANSVKVAVRLGSAVGMPTTDVDVILAGDVCYQEPMTGELVPWLRDAARRGVRVLVGDPGRSYLPSDLVRLGTYIVRTSTELEPADRTRADVYTFQP